MIQATCIDPNSSPWVLIVISVKRGGPDPNHMDRSSLEGLANLFHFNDLWILLSLLHQEADYGIISGQTGALPCQILECNLSLTIGDEGRQPGRGGGELIRTRPALFELRGQCQVPLNLTPALTTLDTRRMTTRMPLRPRRCVSVTSIRSGRGGLRPPR